MKTLVIKNTKKKAKSAVEWWRKMGHPKAYVRKYGKVYHVVG